MAGRKPLYKPESLKIGEKMKLGKNTKYGYQYSRSFNRRFPKMKFNFIDDFIIRIK